MSVGNPKKFNLKIDKPDGPILPEENLNAEQKDVTRLYKRKNSRVKKELNFEVKSNKSKLA